MSYDEIDRGSYPKGSNGGASTPQRIVSDQDFRMDPTQTDVWDTFGEQIDAARKRIDNDVLAFSTILARLSQELRRVFGIEMAQGMLKAFASTMDPLAGNLERSTRRPEKTK